MSVDVHAEEVDIDLSKLINFGVTFEPLQLTLRDILRRVALLERQNSTQDDRIAELSATVAELEEANTALQATVEEMATKMNENSRPAERAAEEAASEHGNSDSDAIWDEIARLNGLLGELQEGAERDRHTIDEIYAARKRHQSISPGTAAATTPLSKPTSAAGGVPRKSTLRAEEEVAPAHVPARQPSAAHALHSAEEAAATKPVGDVILDRAREELPFSDTQVYRAFEEAKATTDGDEGHRVSSAKAAVPPRASSAAGGAHTALPPPPPQPQQSRPHSTSISFASGGLAGGEEAGEHRGSIIAAVRPGSHAQRRSVYADQRIAAAADRRASQFSPGLSGEAGSPASSVFDKLRRDGDDIAYLNRVVAEILGEMKGLQEDVDQLRTQQEEAPATSATTSATEEQNAVRPAGASLDDLEEVRRRLAHVEGDIVDARQQLQHRDDGLQEELDELKRQLRVARSLTDDDLDALRGVRELAEKVKQLEERLRALEGTQGALADQFASVLAVGDKEGEGGASEVNALQFAALQGAVKNLEKQLADLLADRSGHQDWSDDIRRLTEAVRVVEADVEATRDQLQRVVKESARLDEVKANRSELPDLSLLQNNSNSTTKRLSTVDSNTIADIASRLNRAETNIVRLDEDKADRTALHKLRDELNALRQLVELANAQRRGSGDGDEARVAAAAMEKSLREVQRELNNLKAAYPSGDPTGASGLGGEEVEELRDRIDRLDHCKADATLVANKAERDYVENALERLMREVEQVLNATNAGLIDTLEKSLNILRDMIDGKATKQDVANLQGWMAESGGAGTGAGAGAAAADGLTGFKGFRCLGCNRPMENMRPRTLPATMTPFLNRNPQNHPQDNVTRAIQQQQQRSAGGQASSFTLGGRATSGTAAAGSPDGSIYRSTNSEPLPPIE